MTKSLRLQLHNAIDRLPEDQLENVLFFVEMVADDPTADLEDTWMLASGAFRFVLDETENSLLAVPG